MAGILPASANSAAASTKSKSSTDAINDIDLSTFLTLMIKELQNQDPLNPLENKDMLAQLSQIREVGATDKLTATLDSVLLGQNISSATNLIGQEVAAISDKGEQVTGVVDRISIDKGSPKLHVEKNTALEGFGEDGDIDKGTYAYRVVWDDGHGNLVGMDFSGNKAIKTTGDKKIDRSIVIRNLPETTLSKQVYRTDGSGTGDYQLVGTLAGDKSTFVDKTADADRAQTFLKREFYRSPITSRSYDVTLNNISAIRPPATSSSSLTMADSTN
jgi:flagellar basal-body rod modification protein FlgD